MSLSVCIISHKNAKYLDLCLRSATENKVLPETQIVLVLDGPDAASEEVYKRYPGVDVLPLEENVGQSRAHNMAVSCAENDWFVMINDDNILPVAYDKRLLKQARPNCAISPNQCEPHASIFKSFVHKDFGTTPEAFKYDAFMEWEKSIAPPENLAIFHYSEDGGTWPLFMEKKWFMTIGGFDVSFPHASVADWDVFMRLQMAGLTLLRTDYLHLYHFANRGEGGGEKEARSFDFFKWKWGFAPGMDENNSHIPSGQLIRGIQY